MTENWHTRPSTTLALNIFGPMKYLLSGKTFDTTPSWSVASSQFEFLSDPSNGFTNKQVIDVHIGPSSSGKGGVNVAYSDLASRLSSLDVKPGDVMYFYNKEEGVHHATVISKVDDNTIYYSGNTVNRFNQDIDDVIDEESGVLIVRINDEI